MQVLLGLLILGVGIAGGWLLALRQGRIPTQRERKIADLLDSLPPSVVAVLESKPLSGLTIVAMQDLPTTEYVRSAMLEEGAALAEDTTADLTIESKGNEYLSHIVITDRYHGKWTSSMIFGTYSHNQDWSTILDTFISEVIKEIELSRKAHLVRHYRDLMDQAEAELQDPNVAVVSRSGGGQE